MIELAEEIKCLLVWVVSVGCKHVCQQFRLTSNIQANVCVTAAIRTSATLFCIICHPFFVPSATPFCIICHPILYHLPHYPCIICHTIFWRMVVLDSMNYELAAIGNVSDVLRQGVDHIFHVVTFYVCDCICIVVIFAPNPPPSYLTISLDFPLSFVKQSASYTDQVQYSRSCKEIPRSTRYA